jgi:hypothetical protein
VADLEPRPVGTSSILAAPGASISRISLEAGCAGHGLMVRDVGDGF